jgi:hypothetical protein
VASIHTAPTSHKVYVPRTHRRIRLDQSATGGSGLQPTLAQRGIRCTGIPWPERSRTSSALQPRQPISSELRFTMNSGATPPPTGRSRRCLPIARLVAASKRPGAVALWASRRQLKRSGLFPVGTRCTSDRCRSSAPARRARSWSDASTSSTGDRAVGTPGGAAHSAFPTGSRPFSAQLDSTVGRVQDCRSTGRMRESASRLSTRRALLLRPQEVSAPSPSDCF